jgi:hypothetical protein
LRQLSLDNNLMGQYGAIFVHIWGLSLTETLLYDTGL